MPTADGPFPAPNADGLIFSPPSGPGATVTVTSPDCRWWLVIPEEPGLSIPLELVRPSGGAGTLPSGDAAWTGDRAIAQGVHHAFDRPRPIVTHGVVQGEELDLSVVFKGEDAWAAFEAARAALLTALLQSDQVGRQWYVDLGDKAPFAVPQLGNRPSAPIYVVSLHAIEVDAP